ncbi:Regulator of rDNA transcription protein-like protein [Hapsidospora chrysogenum ATCC 11550]|uniref:Regulator of rDNA transcription protein-like protein n=1 Tax=Hapsidospora chrysogenum (strain ATCC 11550 / CBS 779.69 / DSM 880 / IAM 14645 / JCM 23072 / IMI 49137) TaxID=857340 RepID=A0A086TAW8_HAPC1|nr:Regulator of rDNA transcription protein-like protein [Hapsidospora chrysogenum ATCC 11550]
MDSDSSSQPSKRSRVADSVRNNAREVLKEDYGKAKGVALEAAKSRAWFYPIKGIFYFLSHRTLWKPFLSRLPQYIALYGSVVAGMFTFTYLPQLGILVFVNGPFAVVTTVFLVLNESATIVNMVSRNFLLRDTLLDTFDGTLLSRNKTEMVREGREVKSGSDPITKLGKSLKSPFDRFSPKAIVRYFMYLPLNFIPVVGTGIFIFLQARGRGQGVHDRFFQLKKWSSSQRSDWLEKHVGPYTAFGLVATLLEMVPVASMFFTYTNAVGAALWAADIDANDESMTDEKAPSFQGDSPHETGVTDKTE